MKLQATHYKDANLMILCIIGDAELKLGQSGNKAFGDVETAVRTEIVIKGFDPESFLRLLAAAGV